EPGEKSGEPEAAFTGAVKLKGPPAAMNVVLAKNPLGVRTSQMTFNNSPLLALKRTRPSESEEAVVEVVNDPPVVNSIIETPGYGRWFMSCRRNVTDCVSAETTTNCTAS